MADASIYGAYLRPPKSVLDYAEDLDRADMNRLQLAAQRMAFGQQEAVSRQNVAKQNALQALSQDPRLADPLRREEFMLNHPLLSAEGQAMRKSRLEAEKAAADIGKTKADTSKVSQETATARRNEAIQHIGAFQSPQEAIASLQSATDIPPEMKDALLRSIPQNPADFSKWQLRVVLSLATPEQQAAGMAPKMTNAGGAIVNTNPLAGNVPSIPVTQSPDNAATQETTRRGQNMTDSRAREANAISREAQQTQVINDPERGVLLVNKGTKTVVPAMTANGVPLPSESEAKRKSAAKKMMPIIDEADKLIDQATGSYAGAGVDLAARAVGQSTAGADAVAMLKVLEGQLMMAQPRMEGPQSNADVLLYKQMAGQIGDPTVPRDMKKAALKQIRRLQEQYGGSAPAAAPSGASGFKILKVE